MTVIARDGVGRASHRAIAREAEVPLGSTTYYFPSLNVLLEEALERYSTRTIEQLASWSGQLRDVDDLPAAIASLTYDYYVTDDERALIEYELYLAAARTPELRSAARAWLDGIRDLLTPVTGRPAAEAIAALIDGFLIEAIATGGSVSRDTLADAIARQLS